MGGEIIHTQGPDYGRPWGLTKEIRLYPVGDDEGERMSFKEGSDLVGFVGVAAVRGRIKGASPKLSVPCLLASTASLLGEGMPGVARDNLEGQL